VAGEDNGDKMDREIVVKYDNEFDTLYLVRPGLKPKGSIEIGDFIVEFSPELQKAIAIEITNASRVLSSLSDSKITKGMLTNIIRGTFRTIQTTNAVYISYGIICRYKNVETELDNSITVPIKVAV